MKQLLLLSLLLSIPAFGADTLASHPVFGLMRTELSHKYPGARIELVGDAVAVHGAFPAQVERVSLLSENGRGEAAFLAQSAQGASTEVRVDYRVWFSARIASRRFVPGEALTENGFTKKEIDLSQGPAFVYRGTILPASETIARLETRQSILEGQFLVQNAVQKTPDLKRGEWVKIQLVSGDLQLSTTGNAAEPGFTQTSVKVITSKSKRELAGTLRADGVVEVKL